MSKVIYKRHRVSPAMAKRLLANNAHNRNIKQVVVNKYASDMRAGNWDSNNGQTIGITSDNKLVNGQHRLLAVIASDKVVEMDFAYGVEISSRATIDIGKTQSFADYLTMEHHVKNSRMVAAAARISILLMEDKSLDTILNISNKELESELMTGRLKTLIPFVQENATNAKRADGVGGGFALGVMFYIQQNTKFASKPQELLERWATLTNLGVGSPVLAMRTALLRRKEQKVSHNLNAILIIRGYNYFVKNKKANSLVVSEGAVRPEIL